jgi:2'-5' RNA ligase
MKQYFLGIGFEKKTQEFLNQLKKNSSGQRPLSAPAHITLIPPFFVENEEKMVAGFVKWATTQESFDLELEKVGSFLQKKYGTVFLWPQKAEEIKKLYSSLIRNFDWLPKMKNFVPHLTIGQKVPLERVKEVKEVLRMKEIKIKTKVEGIWIYVKEEGEVWKEWERLNFG